MSVLLEQQGDAAPKIDRSVSTAVASFLATAEYAHLAMVLVFEGSGDLAYTTSEDVAGLSSAWSAVSDWDTIRGGLQYPAGTISQSIEPFDATTPMPKMSFTIVDHDDTLISTFFREADITNADVTDLTSSCDSDDTTLTVASTTGWASSGPAFCGTEEMTYASATSTTLAGVTRGVRSIFGPQTSYSFGRPHEIDPETGYKPRVSSAVPFWVGRRVGLYLCHLRDGTWSAGRAGSSSNDAELLWAGRIDEVCEDAAGQVTLDCSFIGELFRTSLLSRQFKAFVREGLNFATAAADIRVTVLRFVMVGGNPTFTNYDQTVATLSGTGAQRTHYEIADSVRTQLQAWYPATTDFALELRLGVDESRPNTYQFDFYDRKTTGAAMSATGSDTVKMWLSTDVWRLLGWDPTVGERVPDSNGHMLVGKTFARDDADPLHYQLVADGPPSRGFVSDYVTSAELTLEDVETGTSFVRQPTIPARFKRDVHGFLRIGGKMVVAVEQLTDTTYVVHHVVDPQTLGPREVVASRDDTLPVLLENGSSDGIRVEQVWLEAGRVGDMMAKLILSTGTAGYNHADYDLYGTSMSVGAPFDLVDVNSILGIGDDPYVLLLDKPEPFLGILERALAVRNLHFVWRRGQMAVVSAGEESAFASSLLRLTEANKAQVVAPGGALAPNTQRVKVYRSMDMMVNRVTLRYQRGFGGEYERDITVNSIASQSDFAQKKSIVQEGQGIYEGTEIVGNGAVKAWASNLAASVLAYFSRPLAILERPYDVNLATRLYPGARVHIVDNAIVNPATGTRGVTGILGWCLATSFDWVTGVGVATIVFSPEHAATKLAAYGPSARVDDTYSSGGYSRGYNAATKTLRVLEHEYTASSDGVDASFFAVGDVVHVVELSPRDDLQVREWTDTVLTVSGSDIGLTTGLSSPAWPSSGYFVIESAPIASATNQQRGYFSYMASTTDLTTGVATRDHYIYSGAPELFRSDVVDYATRYCKRNRDDEDQGEPLSVHKLHQVRDFANTTFGRRVNHWNITVDLGLYIETSDSTNFVFLAGPLWIPFTGGLRNLIVSIRRQNMDATSAAAFRVITSTGLPSGRSVGTAGKAMGFTTVTYPDEGVQRLDVPVPASAALGWSVPLTFRPAVLQGTVPGCWLTLHGKAGTGGALRFHQLHIREEAIT